MRSSLPCLLTLLGGLSLVCAPSWAATPAPATPAPAASAPAGPVTNAPAATAFDAANNLYLTGRYAEAAEAYQKLLETGPRSATLYFNLGNACYKAEQMGRAIAAYRQAERLTPREASLRANLQFMRKKLNGDERGPGPFWREWLATLTLNEWTALAAGLFWLWFLTLALCESRPALKPPLRRTLLTLGVAMLLGLVCLAGSAYDRFGTRSAVVCVREAVLRFGPLQESRVSHQLQDGAEVTVLDEKDNWLQVRDRKGRLGWLKRDHVVVL